MSIILTEAASSKVKGLLSEEKEEYSLRIAVQPGGCSGLRYQLFFDNRSLDGDVVQIFNGVSVVTDRMSSPYLDEAVVDFTDTMEQRICDCIS